jgi:hypothetical protein
MAKVSLARQREELGRWCCRMANMKFVGIQCMYGVIPDALLFQPTSGVLAGSTLAVPADNVTPLALAYRAMDAVAEARKQPKQVAA